MVTHYKVICISLYNEDLRRLDEKVEQLKKRGVRRASRSALIRHALDCIEPHDVPRDLGSEQDEARRSE